jgi:hypothetical protein
LDNQFLKGLQSPAKTAFQSSGALGNRSDPAVLTREKVYEQAGFRIGSTMQ